MVSFWIFLWWIVKLFSFVITSLKEEVVPICSMHYALSYNLMVRLFNRLTANYEYSPGNRDNLPLPIETQLPKKSNAII